MRRVNLWPMIGSSQKNTVLKMPRFCTETGFDMPKTTALFIVSAVVLSAYVQCNGAVAVRLSEAEIDTKLLALEPLPKVHYSFTFLHAPNDRCLYEYARITHALTVSGEWVKRERLDKCVYTCARINKTNPKIRASIAAGFAPWHRRFGKTLPPTDRGHTYYEEIRYFSQRLQLIKKWLSQSNGKYGSDVKLSAILFDTERFSVLKGNERWNEGIREALDEGSR